MGHQKLIGKMSKSALVKRGIDQRNIVIVSVHCKI